MRGEKPSNLLRHIAFENTASEFPVGYIVVKTETSSLFTASACITDENNQAVRTEREATPQSRMGTPMYALQDVPGKGKGLVAMKTISKGTRILSEEPIITIASDNDERMAVDIAQQVEALSEHQRQAFLSLHNIYPYKNAGEQYIGIFHTNGLPGEEVGDIGGIFLEACRLNHACDNNAQRSWNQNIKRHTVHALRDINKGEEITVTYLKPLRNRKDRQKLLLDKFGFTCLCHLCSLQPAQSRESDKRLEEIARIDYVIHHFDAIDLFLCPLPILRYYDRQIGLYNEQGREDVGFVEALTSVARILLSHSDMARGRIFAERALSVWKTTLGNDSSQAIEYEALAKDPSKYEMYGYSPKWNLEVDKVPRGLEPNDFEDWLWKREEPRHQGHLGNRTIFPGFTDLPNRNKVNSDTSRPQRHWCFLGEIVDSNTLHHLEFKTRYIDDRIVPIHFYTDGLGKEVTPSLIQKGHTIAVLYATLHKFMFDAPGIRHEDPGLIKVRSL